MKSNFIEAGFLGEEFFENKEKEIIHQCITINSVVSRGVFSLEEALKAYEITREEYDKYGKSREL